MIEEGISKIVSLVRQGADAATTQKVTLPYKGGLVEYEAKVNVDKDGRTIGNILTPFRAAKLEVTTLAGFVDAMEANIQDGAGDTIVHVEDYLTVTLKTRVNDVYGVRDTLLVAKHSPVDAFKFDDYYQDPARFIIGLQVAFLMTEELLQLIKLVSHLKSGDTVQVNDDGRGQTVTVKTGEVTAADVKVGPRIKLVPIRTFSEASPVETEFLIRFKSIGDVPSPALFNVDGTKWKDQTMQSIKRWLQKELAAGTVILA